MSIIKDEIEKIKKTVTAKNPYDTVIQDVLKVKKDETVLIIANPATVEIAQANPEINYLGIEVHTPGVGKVLSEIQKRDLKNLYIIEYDALEVLDKMIGNNSVNGIHIFFPDPWPKKRHHKRRMLQRPRTDLMAQKLAPSGYLYFVTDIVEYAEFALEELSLTKGLKNKYDGFAEPQTWRTQTKFERKGLAQDRQITEIFFEKQ